MPESRNVSPTFANRLSGSPTTQVNPFWVADQRRSASIESNNQATAGMYGTATPGPVKKKPVPALGDELFGGSLNSASPLAPVGSAGLLKSQGPTSSDDPYQGCLVDVSTPVSRPPITTPAPNRSLEPITNPFADPEDPFSDPRNANRLSAHSGNSDLSYASLRSSQGDGVAGNADVARHVSMKSGLSYASLTPSQIQRRMNYVPPPLPALSDTSSDRRLSDQSAMTASSFDTVKGL
jgi:hypothetical protein